ncbi:Type IV secretory pathway, VirD4 components [Klebsiella pneumoniae]|nr:Type IV secretory pathway, VirD4 components [Klebsiella pneumoniae]
MVFFGTTGSGKTETFYGFIVNFLLWCRGYCLSDGKADNKLAFATWSLARRFGREDDYYVLNLLTGSIDRFVNLVKQESIPAQSNSVNLFSVAPPTFIIQLMESMLPQVGGDSAQWQDTAKAMMSALINALCYKRARGELLLSQRTYSEKHVAAGNGRAVRGGKEKTAGTARVTPRWKVIWKIHQASCWPTRNTRKRGKPAPSNSITT